MSQKRAPKLKKNETTWKFERFTSTHAQIYSYNVKMLFAIKWHVWINDNNSNVFNFTICTSVHNYVRMPYFSSLDLNLFKKI